MIKTCPVCGKQKSRPGTRWKNCSQECRDKFPIDSNENRSDNRPENLQHFPNKSAHNSHHKELDHATK